MERPRSWKSKVPIQNLCFGDEKEMDRRHLNQSPRFRDLADFIYFFAVLLNGVAGFLVRTRRLTPGRVGVGSTVPPEGGTQGRRQQEVREEGSRADAYGSGAVLWQRKTRVVRGKT